MSVMLPGDLVFVLNLIGFNWPAADEDKLRQSAQHWREYASELEHVMADTSRILERVRSDNSSESIDALEQHWRDFGEHLSRGHDAAGTVAEVLDEFALVVEGLKLKVVLQLGLLADKRGDPEGGTSCRRQGRQESGRALLEHQERAQGAQGLKDGAERLRQGPRERWGKGSQARRYERQGRSNAYQACTPHVWFGTRSAYRAGDSDARRQDDSRSARDQRSHDARRGVTRIPEVDPGYPH